MTLADFKVDFRRKVRSKDKIVAQKHNSMTGIAADVLASLDFTQ